MKRLFSLGSLVLAASTAVQAKDDKHKHDKHLLSPKEMLSLPRPAPAIPNELGTQAVSLVTVHDFETRRGTTSLYLIDLNPGPKNKGTQAESTPLELVRSDDTTAISEPIWLDERTVGYLNTTDGQAELWSLPLPHDHSPERARRVHTFPVPPTGLKFKPLPARSSKGKDASAHARTGVLAFSGHVWKSGSIEDTERLDREWEGREDEGEVWDETYIREWDTWRNPGKVHQLFLTLVDLSPSSTRQPDHLAPFNSSAIYSHMQPIGKADYDLHTNSVDRISLVVSVKDNQLDDAFHTRRHVYVTNVHLEPSTTSRAGSYPYTGLQFSSPPTDEEPLQLTSGSRGAVTSVSFDPTGRKVVWLEMNEDGKEADKNDVVVYDLGKRKREAWTGRWDRSPSSVSWARDGHSLYLIAEDQGSALPYHLTHPNHLPTPLLFNGSTVSFLALGNGSGSTSASASDEGESFLVTLNSMTRPNEDHILRLPSPSQPRAKDGNTLPPDGDKLPLASLTRITHWASKGLQGKLLPSPESFWFAGASGEQVMGWMLKPPGFRRGEKGRWPAVLLIHGGPQAAWEDAWSTRWNPGVFAAQGYVTIAINPHGSTGYGQRFTDSIDTPKNDWGGKPYRDLLAGLEHVLHAHPEVDRDRLVAAGGSFGGYMVNWLQGHNDGETRFRAFVNHDGVFDVHSMYYSTEQVYFSERSAGGLTPWEDRSQYENFNPMNFVGNWKTPMLVIHGGQDFRIPDSQGIAAFTACQRRGIPSRLLYFAKENHWVLNPQNSLRWHTEVFKWFDEFVGVREQEALVLQS